MSYIQRAITPILKQRVSTSKCMLLVGARQVGKSTLIKHEFKDFNRANFDDRLTRMQAKEEPKLFFLNNPQPLFIDEVQKESSILEDIKQIVDESDERGMFILSGSQKLELMKGMSESLAGRVSISELTGLSMREIYGVKFNRHFIPTDAYIKERENEIDLVIEEDGVLYPVEIKMSGNPKASMGATNQVLDKVSDKKRGLGVILCLIDKKTYLRENLVALPIEFI